MKRSFGCFSFTGVPVPCNFTGSTVNEKLGILCALCILKERSEWAVNMVFLLHSRESSYFSICFGRMQAVTKESILLFALGITEKGIGWS